jgi:hypothetical protein
MIFHTLQLRSGFVQVTSPDISVSDLLLKHNSQHLFPNYSNIPIGVDLMRSVILTILSLILLSTTAQAEIYRDISPLSSFGEVKNLFPGASFKRTFPAWAQKSDVMYQITGSGISGTIIVKFDDLRSTWKEMAEEVENEESKASLLEMSNQTDEEAMEVSWVRWVPDGPVPIKRFISKYGKPEKSGFSDEDYQPYRKWITKGVLAYLSDDETHVIRIDFLFTKEELKNAYWKKFKRIPSWLKEQSKTLSTKKKRSP